MSAKLPIPYRREDPTIAELLEEALDEQEEGLPPEPPFLMYVSLTERRWPVFVDDGRVIRRID